MTRTIASTNHQEEVLSRKQKTENRNITHGKNRRSNLTGINGS